MSAAGFDFLFTDETETARLDHELEKYDPVTGEVVIWVRIPALSNAADTIIYVYFGNGSLSSSQEARASLWSSGGFKGVWHLGEPSGSALDATVYGAHGTIVGAVTQGAAGRIGMAYAFPGTAGPMVHVGDPPDGHLDFGISSFSFGAWIFVNASTGTWQHAFGKGGTDTPSVGYSIETTPDATGIYGGISDGIGNWVAPVVPFGLGQWRHVVVVIDRGADVMRTYVDGVEVLVAPLVGEGDVSTPVELAFGNQAIDGDIPLNGRLDEVRIAGVLLSADWIATEFNNQQSPSTFFTVMASLSQFTAPTFLSTPGPSASCGLPFIYNASASGDAPITWSLAAAPSGMTVDSAAGVVRWVPSGDQAGSNGATLVASGPGGSTPQPFTVDVACGPVLTYRVGCACDHGAVAPLSAGSLLGVIARARRRTRQTRPIIN